jgi:hypothetical protein
MTDQPDRLEPGPTALYVDEMPTSAERRMRAFWLDGFFSWFSEGLSSSI